MIMSPDNYNNTHFLDNQYCQDTCKQHERMQITETHYHETNSMMARLVYSSKARCVALPLARTTCMAKELTNIGHDPSLVIIRKCLRMNK